MRTIDYSEVLQRAAEATGRIYKDLSAQEATLMRGFFSTRLKQIWEKWPWPDLMTREERKFRAEWSGATTYGLGTDVANQVYYTPAKKYYQSLRTGNTNHAPATGSLLVENSAWWSELEAAYSANDYSATHAYAAGDQVYYPTTGLFYQCQTASTGNPPPNPPF